MTSRRRNPFPILIAATLVPAFVLAGLGVVSGEQRISASESADTAVTELPPPLTTPLLNVRREPTVLARGVNLSAFATEAESFVELVDSTSCLALAVDGIPVAAQNADLPLRPASNQKVLTASAVDEVLGEEFRYTTEVRGQVNDDGTVDGDLVLVGGGDPVLSESWWAETTIVRYPPFNITSMEQLADQVVAAGVRRVTGNIVGDGTRYDGERYAPDVSDDAKAELEALPISALVVNDLRTSPTSTSSDPDVGAAVVLRRLLDERGVAIDGTAVAGAAGPDLAVVTSIQSAPMPDLLAEMLTTSDNLSADMMIKELGVASGGSGSFSDGLAEVRRVLEELQIPVDGLVLADGAGLSDGNRVSCRTLLAVLQHGDVEDAVGQGMPVAGAENGTLAGLFQDSTLEGRLRAKTGTLGNADGEPDKPGAKALSGYVPTDGAGTIEFSLLLNGEQIADQGVYRPIWDAFADLLESYPSGPTAEQLAPR